MESVEELCDSIVLIDKSKKILDGKVSEIKNRFRNNHYVIKYNGTIPLINPEANNLFRIVSLRSQENETKATIEILENHRINEVLGYLITQVEIKELVEIVPSIHDIFVKQVKENY